MEMEIGSGTEASRAAVDPAVPVHLAEEAADSAAAAHAAVVPADLQAWADRAALAAADAVDETP